MEPAIGAEQVLDELLSSSTALAESPDAEFWLDFGSSTASSGTAVSSVTSVGSTLAGTVASGSAVGAEDSGGSVNNLYVGVGSAEGVGVGPTVASM